MQFKFFTIPAGVDACSFEDELNHFVRAHRVLSVKKEFASDGAQSRWCICVEYMEGQNGELQERASWQTKERIDYREVLSEGEFTRFARLRSIRKTIAENEHIPAYAIMKDDMLAELAKRSEVDEKALKALAGFGDKKFEKYGHQFLTMLAENKERDEASGQSVSSNQ